jgi:uncharacterized protein YjiS (DUF1127 family)
MFMLRAALRFVRESSRRTSVPFRTTPFEKLAALAHALGREWCIRADIAYAASLDDRMLRDIGVYRGELERYVRFGRAPGRTRAGPVDPHAAALMPFPKVSAAGFNRQS